MRSITLVATLLLAVHAFADPKPTETGKVKYQAIDDQADVAKCYRLEPYEFEYQLKPRRELVVSGIDIYDLTFPSPVKTKYRENNTVHAEYFVPKGKGPFPGVILLDILDGSMVVSHGIATILTSQGIAALCVQLPYYGPRRPPGAKSAPGVRRHRSIVGGHSPGGARQSLCNRMARIATGNQCQETRHSWHQSRQFHGGAHGCR